MAEKTEVTVFKASHYYRRKDMRVHLCTSKVPSDAMLQVRGQSVVSPEFAYLQVAARLPPLEAILLGILLCARPEGYASEPITARKKLLRFARKARRFCGRNRALKALKYVRDGCNSILEGIEMMLACLPHRLGGCGFGEGEFDREITLDEEGARLLGQRTCRLDVYLVRYGVVLEYDSFKYHNNATSHGRDSMRQIVLSRHGPRGGLILISVKTIQLYKPAAFQELFHHIAAKIGKRIRIRTPKYADMYEKLRQLLPRRSPGSGPIWEPS